MAVRFWDRDGLALGLATIIFAPYRNKTVSYVFYFALILFKLSLILDPNLLLAENISLKEYDKKYQSTLIARNSVLVKLLKIPDVVTYLKFNATAVLYGVLAFSLGWFLLSSVTLANYSRFKKWNTYKPDHRPESPFYFGWLTAMIYNYDFFFIMIVNLFIQGVTCVKFPAEMASNSTQSGIIKVGEERAQDSSTVITSIRACGLNKGIGCLVLNHYFVCLVVGVIMACNLWLKFCSHLVLTYSPEPSILLSQTGIVSLFHSAVVIGLMAGKSYIMNQGAANPSAVDIYMITVLCALAIDLCLYNLFIPFYSPDVSKLRLAENIGMMLLATLVLMIRNSNFDIILSVNSSLVLLCLLFTSLLKAALNFQGKRATLKLLEDSQSLGGTDLSRIAYRGFEFLTQYMATGGELNRNQLQTLTFFLNLRRMKERSIFIKNLEMTEVALGPLLNLIHSKVKKTNILQANKEKAIKKQPNQDQALIVRSPSTSEANSSEHNIHKPVFSKISGLTLRKGDSLFPPKEDALQLNMHPQSMEELKEVEIKNNELLVKPIPVPNKRPPPVFARQGTLKEKKRSEYEPKPTTSIADVLKHKRSDPIKDEEEAIVKKKEPEEQDQPEALFNLEIKPLIIDKFDELRDNNAREILMLISELTDDCFERLSKSSNSSLSTVRELLTISVMLCLNYLGNIPMAMLKLYQAQQVFSRMEVKRKDRNKDFGSEATEVQSSILSNSLRLEIIRSVVSLTLRHNSQTSELVLREERSKLANRDNTENNLKIFKLLHFINTYRELKDNIYKAVGVKNALLSDMAENKAVNYEDVYKASRKFNKSVNAVAKNLPALKELASPQFTGLRLVEGYYLAYLQQDINRGQGVIDKMMAIGITMNYNFINFDSKRYLKFEEKVAIGASGEVLSFHEINFASANTKLYLGYHAGQLLEKDLSILMPEPIKSKHHHMLSSKDSNGMILESTGPIPVVAIDSDDLAIQCRLSVRLNFLLEKGLQFLGFLDFSVVDKEDCFVLLDEKGKITHTNFEAYRYLEPQTDIAGYDPSFTQSFKDYNRVANFIARNPSMDIEKMLNDPRIYNFNKNYYNMALGSEANIIDKKKKLRQVHYLVNDYYIYRLQACLRTFHFKAGKANMSMNELGNIVVTQMASRMSVRNHSTTYNDQGVDDDDFGSIGNASSLLHTLNEDDCLRLAAKISSDDRRQDRVTAILLAIEKKIDLLDLIADQILARKGPTSEVESIFSSGDDLQKEELVPMRSFQKSMELARNNHVMNDSMRFALYFDLWFKEKQIKAKKDSIKTIFNFKGLFAKKLALNHLKKVAKHAANIKKEIQLGVIMPKEAIKGERNKVKLSRIIINKLNYKFVNTKTVTFMIILFLCICIQFGIGYFKFYLGSMVNSEVRHKLLASDLNSWVVWATANLILLVDTSRAVYEGYLSNSAYSYLGGGTILAANTQLKATMTGTLQGVSLQYRFMMQNVTMPVFHQADRYSKYPVIETWEANSIDWTRPPTSAVWKMVKRNFYEAISIAGPVAERYLKRNDSAYTATKIGLDRDKDLLTEYIRKNLGNDLLQVVMDDGKDIASYFTNICAFNSFLSNYGDVLQLKLLIIVATVVLIVLIMTRIKMAKFYELMFEIRVITAYLGQRY